MRLHPLRLCLFATALLSTLQASGIAAQTDYYNTDSGRPILIEDAYATERYAFELQIAPVTLERTSAGYDWGVEPEIAYGVLPRTHVEVGFPLAYHDSPGVGGKLGLAGVDVSILHNLNTETATLPAMALAAEVLLPAGSFAPANAYAAVKAVVTRTYPFARFHINARYTAGAEPEAGEEGIEALSRWLGGVAIDKTFPLRALLVTAELYARKPMAGSGTDWSAGAGIRYQMNPRWALDAGMGKHLTGAEQSWFITFGSAYAFAVRSLIPVPK